MPENRVLKYNDANVQRQTEVNKQHNNAAGGRNKKGFLQFITISSWFLMFYYCNAGTPKGKKSETGGSTPKDGALSSESRASTPSKELNTTPMPGPSTPAANAAGNSSLNSSSAGRSSNRKQNATPVSDVSSKKDEESSKEDSKDEPPKKKRGISSSNSNNSTNEKDKSQNTASSNSSNANQSNSQPNSATSTRQDSCVESEESFLSKVEVKIRIPDELRQYLADDWDAVTRQHKLLDLPARITVQDIVDQYLNYKKTAKTSFASKEVAIADVLNGIVEYFNVMLGCQLLYKFERPQYAEILQQHPDTPLSKIYGAFHLLRLFVKLGSMLGWSCLDEKHMQILVGYLHDFLKFLVKNSATYFSMSSFANCSTEYHRNTQ